MYLHLTANIKFAIYNGCCSDVNDLPEIQAMGRDDRQLDNLVRAGSSNDTFNDKSVCYRLLVLCF